MKVNCKKDYDRALSKIRSLEGVIDGYAKKQYPKILSLPIKRSISEIRKEIDVWKESGGEGGFE